MMLAHAYRIPAPTSVSFACIATVHLLKDALDEARDGFITYWGWPSSQTAKSRLGLALQGRDAFEVFGAFDRRAMEEA